MRGSASAPVEITEYADYQCPFCQTFATLQMPTIEERLIKTGRLRWRYRDFPLQQHPFSRLAAHSAACADEQGKYWDQHERIYEGQAEWSAARDARRHLPELRQGAVGWTSGSTTPAWSPASTPAGSRPATRRAPRPGVISTPTLLVGDRLYRGRFDSDAIRRLVDSLSPPTP